MNEIKILQNQNLKSNDIVEPKFYSPLKIKEKDSSGKIKVALIWPKGFDVKYVMPLALGYLKSNLNSDLYDCKIFDNSLNDHDSNSKKFLGEIVKFNPHVVGISTWSPTFEEALKVAKEVKKIDPKIITVIGGAHASSYSEKVIKFNEFDFLFKGEADLSFGKFLDELRLGTNRFDEVLGLVFRDASTGLVKVNEQETRDDVDVIRPPDYDAMRLFDYHAAGYRWNTPQKKNAPIWVTRGCPYRCTFCAAPDLNGRPIRKHSVKYMVDEVVKLYRTKGILHFNIIDDNFTFDKRYAKEFCKAMIELNLPKLGFGTPNGIRMNRGDAELWALMKKAGWKTLILAPESGSEFTLEIMKKDLDVTTIPGIVKEIRDAGLKTQAFFILGYPGERVEDIEKSFDLIKKCDFNFVFMNNFQPLPGTPVYDDMVKKGLIEDGLMPVNYSDGVRVYTSPELENFNFPKFILKVYIYLALRHPTNIPYMFTLFDPLMIVRKIFKNIYRVVVNKKITEYSSAA